MSAPVVIIACKCGRCWDTHGRYNSCPLCGAAIQSCMPADEAQASAFIAGDPRFYAKAA
jgi:hypothetical protein